MQIPLQDFLKLEYLSKKISTIIHKYSNQDYLHFLKVCQAIRLLSRGKDLQKLLLNDKVFEKIEISLINIIKENPSSNHEVVDNILIEIISITKRLVSGKDSDNEFTNKVLHSEFFDRIIFLLHKDNPILLKNLHILLISLIDKYVIVH